MTRLLVVLLCTLGLACQAADTLEPRSWSAITVATVVEAAGEGTLARSFQGEPVLLADPRALALEEAWVTEDGHLQLRVAATDREALLGYTESRVGRQLALLIGDEVVSVAVLQSALDGGLQIAPSWADPVRRHAESAELLSALRPAPRGR